MNRHFTYVRKDWIARKLFKCHRCESKCKAVMFRKFNETQYIATAYDCDKCGLRFITSPHLFDA